MTFDKLKKTLVKFVDKSRVNLGRQNTATRKQFIDDLIDILDSYEPEVVQEKPEKQSDIKVLKSTPKLKRLITGKGGAAMTGTESHRADKELGRSPY